MMSFSFFKDPLLDPFLDNFEEELKKIRSSRFALCKKLCFLITIGGLSAATFYLAKESHDIRVAPSYESQGSDLIMISFCALLTGGVTLATLCCCIRQFLSEDNSDNIFIRDLPLHMQNNVQQLGYNHGLPADRLLTVGDVRSFCKEKNDMTVRELGNLVA